MPRTRNLQTTNRNVRSPKTMTRPVRPGGTGRRIRPSPMRLPLGRSRAVFAVTVPAASLRARRKPRGRLEPRSHRDPHRRAPTRTKTDPFSLRADALTFHEPNTSPRGRWRFLVQRAGPEIGFARGARASAFTLGTEGHSANVVSAAIRQSGDRAGESKSDTRFASVVETSFREHETARAF